jgi:hypothetical protein
VGLATHRARRSRAVAAAMSLAFEDRVGVDRAARLLPSGVELELVRLPVAMAEARAAVAAKRGPRARIFVVERVLGHGWAVAYESASPAAATRDAGALPERLAIEDCARPLQALASRAAFAFGRGRAADLAELGPVVAATYPFWLRYRRGRGGRIRFAALDAVTGQRPGSALRAALAAALIDADARGVPESICEALPNVAGSLAPREGEP